MWKATCSVLVALVALQEVTAYCNPAVCGGIVSKCLLTKACMCEGDRSSCRKQCLNCLDLQVLDCCSCVGMCSSVQQPTFTVDSNVERLTSSFPALFNTLTEYSDQKNRWKSVTYPVQKIDYGRMKKFKSNNQNAKQEISRAELLSSTVTMNCSVAFLSKCTTMMKCKSQCENMGATGYRWFYDGCCECVGEHCIHYGINQSKCRECSYSESTSPESDDDYNYVDIS